MPECRGQTPCKGQGGWRAWKVVLSKERKIRRAQRPPDFFRSLRSVSTRISPSGAGVARFPLHLGAMRVGFGTDPIDLGESFLQPGRPSEETKGAEKVDYFAGIDGGGTKTTLLWQNREGQTLGKRVLGPLNINGTDQQSVDRLLEELVCFFQEQGRCLAVCMGAAGVSNPRLRTLVAQTMEKARVEHWQLVGDSEIALAGALEGSPGCALIAGTGSICVGSDREGNLIRAGGWGHLLGDEGSGYALGRDALRAVTRFWDRNGDASYLADLLAGRFGIRDRQSMISYVYEGNKSRVAAVAPLVEQAAAEKDPAAEEILARHARALGELSKTVVRQLNMERGEIAMMGGLLQQDTLLRRHTAAILKKELPTWPCIPPRRTAAEGAVLLARRMVDEP